MTQEREKLRGATPGPSMPSRTCIAAYRLLQWHLVRRLFPLLALVALLGARPAFADASPASLGELQSRLVKQENESAQLTGRRVRLEQESNDLGAEIERVQAEPAGVRRDFKLRELLAQAQDQGR